MTDPTPDTQQIEMLKTLLHDSRTERTRLADEVDRLRALADPAPVGRDDVAHDEGWAIAIISNVDAPEVGWPQQTEEWRTAARSWLDSVHAPASSDPAPVGLTEVRINIAGDALMTAWAIIANAWEGDWSQAPDEWRAAAERWRDEDFHPLLDALQEDDHD